MPINLFYPKGTETIIVVFKTGEPNSGSTWLARYDDGYELIRQRKARTPTSLAQEHHGNLIQAFNHRLETDYSLNKVLDYRDQWVYTVHEASDYSVTQRHLQIVLNEYISYLYQNHFK